jgi:hypothetical protein
MQIGIRKGICCSTKTRMSAIDETQELADVVELLANI